MAYIIHTASLSLLIRLGLFPVGYDFPKILLTNSSSSISGPPTKGSSVLPHCPTPDRRMQALFPVDHGGILDRWGGDGYDKGVDEAKWLEQETVWLLS